MSNSKWDKRMLDMAQLVASWSSCFNENRSVGCVIAKNNRVLATGYNGAPAGMPTCKDKQLCMRKELNIASGTRMEVCYAVHAEQNAIVQAAKLGVSVDGATLYCTHQPCSTCAKMIINAGIKRVVFLNGYPDTSTFSYFLQTGVAFERMDPATGSTVPVESPCTTAE